MRPQLFSLFFLLTTGTACFAQFKNSNEPMDGPLKGKVDSVIVSYFNIKAGGVKELNDRNTYLYNATGLLIEDRISDFDSTESRQFKTTYSYDNKGNYSQMLDYNLSGELKRKELYSFDPVKRLVEIKSVNGTTTTTTLLLDKQGNILEDTNYQLDTIFSITRYKYNNKGFCVESFKTWTASTDTQKILYAYKADGNLIKESSYKNSRLLETRTYSYPKYDKKHNWVIQNTYQNGRLATIGERTIAYRK